MKAYRVCSQRRESGPGLQVFGDGVGGLEAIVDVALESSLSLKNLRVLGLAGWLVEDACRERDKR